MNDTPNWQGYAKQTNWVGTLHGGRIDLIAPKPGEINIRDVCSGLGNQCRFTGQVIEFYSIAEHSIHVSELVERHGYPELAFDALFHDGPEAYIGDCSTPLKREIGHCYNPIEHRLREAFATRFGLKHTVPQHEVITYYDRVALMTERDAIQPNHADWGPEFEGFPRDPYWRHRWPIPKDARAAFLARFLELASAGGKRAVTVW